MSEIFERMAARMPDWMDMREGSYAGDNLRAVAAELERIQSMGIEYMPNRFFPLIAAGEDLTLAAENFGITRKTAAKAKAEVTLTGAAGKTFSDIKAAAGEMIFDLEDGVIGADGKVTVTATAETAGAAGNVMAGKINELVAVYEGIESAHNGEAAYGGADEETDEALRERVRVRFRSPSTGGNKADYESWALEQNGVYAACAFNPEGGKVEVYIVGEELKSASEEITAAVGEAIDERRPLGASTAVYAAEAVDINVGVRFGIMEGYDRETVIEDMRKRVYEYLLECCFKSDVVSYLKIAGVLFAEGVSDIEDYTLNGARESISIGEKQFAALGGVTEI